MFNPVRITAAPANPFQGAQPRFSGQVRFGQDDNAPDAPKDAPAAGDVVDLPKQGPDAETPETEPKQPSKPQGSGMHNTKAAIGFLFQSVVPLVLGVVPFFGGGPVGMVFSLTIGGIASYISGKIGRKILKNVEDEHLNGLMLNVKDFHDTLEKPDSGSNLVEKLNTVLGDLLDVRRIPVIGQWLAKTSLPIVKEIPIMLRSFSRIKPNGTAANLLNKYALFKANVFSDVAQADSAGEAITKGVKGGSSYFLYFVVARRVGEWVEKLGQGNKFMKLLGWGIKNMGFLKFLNDGRQKFEPDAGEKQGGSQQGQGGQPPEFA